MAFPKKHFFVHDNIWFLMMENNNKITIVILSQKHHVEPEEFNWISLGKILSSRYLSF